MCLHASGFQKVSWHVMSTLCVQQGEIRRLEAVLKKLNPTARIITTSFCQVDLAEVLNTKR